MHLLRAARPQAKLAKWLAKPFTAAFKLRGLAARSKEKSFTFKPIKGAAIYRGAFLFYILIEKSFSVLLFVIESKSSTSIPLRSAIFFAVYLIIEESHLLPRSGTGAM